MSSKIAAQPEVFRACPRRVSYSAADAESVPSVADKLLSYPALTIRSLRVSSFAWEGVSSALSRPPYKTGPSFADRPLSYLPLTILFPRLSSSGDKGMCRPFLSVRASSFPAMQWSLTASPIPVIVPRCMVAAGRCPVRAGTFPLAKASTRRCFSGSALAFFGSST